MDVDGQANSLVELNSQAPPAGPQNPHGNAFVMQETALRTEQQAQRDLNFASSRAWKVINPNVTNALGANTSYILAPGENAIPYALPDSPIRRRAAFLNHHLWATRYQSEELAAAGPYPNQSKGGDGLVKYSADDASLVDQDLVLWYTLGVTHIPRPEEWPVMPTAHAGFRLIPAGFFAQNPGLYVPGPANR
jgi:primary-amine oxidase